MPTPVGSGSGRFTYAQLEGLWINAGGSRAAAPVAAAIAEAESGGNPNAESANPDGGTNVGLWQLDTLGKGSGHTAGQLLDPATNAKVAVQGSRNGRDWTAWSTFTSGAFRRFLSPKTSPDLSVPGPVGGAASVNAAAAAGGTPGGPAQTSTCLLSVPGGSILGFSLWSGGCLFAKHQARAFAGGFLLAAGGVVTFTGLAVLVSSAFAKTPAGQAIGGAVGMVPGGTQVRAVMGNRAAGRQVQARRRERAAADARYERQMGSGVENRELRTGRGAIRETAGETRRRKAIAASDRAPF